MNKILVWEFLVYIITGYLHFCVLVCSVFVEFIVCTACVVCIVGVVYKPNKPILTDFCSRAKPLIYYKNQRNVKGNIDLCRKTLKTLRKTKKTIKNQ